jgi:methylthioribose-1-phosphate isomerase
MGTKLTEADDILQPVRWVDGAVELLDQTLLPHTYRRIRYTSVAALARAIKEMRVRGAPAIGITAGYGYALAAHSASEGQLADALAYAYDTLLATRPTAVNLAWVLQRMRSIYKANAHLPVADLQQVLLSEAKAIHEESYRADRELSRLGAKLLRGRKRILTHCNTGPLATAGYGTALGVIRSLYEENPTVTVLADETRPFLQGARLTAWELQTLGIPVTVITDSTAGYLMQLGEVDAVIVGADRIAANGDVANKIGTYSLAVLAAAHGIPFYVAAPTATIDLSISVGAEIPIEERAPEEVLEFGGVRVAPQGVTAKYLAFDITPAHYIAAIITERGIFQPPLTQGLQHLQVGNRTAPVSLDRGQVEVRA